MEVFVETEWPWLINVSIEKEHFSREEATYLANTILDAVEKSERYELIDADLKSD